MAFVKILTFLRFNLVLSEIDTQGFKSGLNLNDNELLRNSPNVTIIDTKKIAHE